MWKGGAWWTCWGRASLHPPLLRTCPPPCIDSILCQSSRLSPSLHRCRTRECNKSLAWKLDLTFPSLWAKRMREAGTLEVLKMEAIGGRGAAPLLLVALPSSSGLRRTAPPFCPGWCGLALEDFALLGLMPRVESPRSVILGEMGAHSRDTHLFLHSHQVQ